MIDDRMGGSTGAPGGRSQPAGHRCRAGAGRRARLAVALVAAGALALTACGGSSAPTGATAPAAKTSTAASAGQSPAGPLAPKPLAQKTSVTFGYSAPLEVFATPQIAAQNGEFTKENLDVTVKKVAAASWPQLLAQGDIQFMIGGFSAGLMNAISRGIDITVVGSPYKLAPDDPSGLYVQKKFLQPDGSLKKPLPSNFSVTLGDQGYGAVSIYWTQQYFKQNGLSIIGTRNVNLSQPDIALALQRGSVDAGFANDPYAGQLTSVSTVQKVADAGSATVIATTKGYISQHRDVVEAVLRALARTNSTLLAPGYRDNQSVMGQISSWLGVSTSVIDKSPAPVFQPNLDLSILKPIVEDTQQTWLQAGGILTYKSPLSFDAISDASVLSEALGQ